MMINDVVRIASVMDIHRVHRLPFPGRVLVNVGTSVHFGDPIAEAEVPGDVIKLDLAKGLGISPSEVPACLIRESGEYLQQDDVIAQCEGPLPRLVRAPVEGKVLQCHNGVVFLATGKSTLRLKARMVGVVEAVLPEYGVIISCQGSLIQGVWGNGGMGEGVLNVIEASFVTPLEGSMLDTLEGGQVLAAGSCLQSDVLRAIKQKDPAGLILESLSPDLISVAKAMPLPVIVLSGFGHSSLNTASFELLRSRSGACVSVNAWKTDCFEGRRPEVIIPCDEGEPEVDYGFRQGVAVGHKVRILSGPVVGQVGEVLALSDEPTQFESGLAFPSALIKLECGDQVRVPQQNVLII